MKGGLVAIFVVLLVGFRHFAPELAIAVAIYVLAAALSLTERSSLDYGAFIGFAGAALLLVAVALQPRKPARVGARFVPVAACVLFLAIPVTAMTGRLPRNLEIYTPWGLVLLGAAAIVVGLRLIGRWLTGPSADGEVLLLPVVLLALVVLDLGEMHQDVVGFNWEGWLAFALAVLLVVLGWVERSGGGLNRLRIPDEIWRVDRISTGEH